MRFLKVAAVAAALVAAVLATPAIAAATYVRPSTAPVLDAAGVDSGCKVNIVFQRKTSSYVYVNAGMRCTHDWYRASNLIGWQRADSSPRSGFVDFGGVGSTGKITPNYGYDFKVKVSALCAGLSKGTHTFVLGSRGQVNAARNDGHPYKGIAEVKVSVVCP